MVFSSFNPQHPSLSLNLVLSFLEAKAKTKEYPLLKSQYLIQDQIIVIKDPALNSGRTGFMVSYIRKQMSV